MTFEDSLLDKAQKDLESTEKLCAQASGKVMSSLKKAFGISSSASLNKLNQKVIINRIKS
jgi:hypothetical protein